MEEEQVEMVDGADTEVKAVREDIVKNSSMYLQYHLLLSQSGPQDQEAAAHMGAAPAEPVRLEAQLHLARTAPQTAGREEPEAGGIAEEQDREEPEDHHQVET